MAILVADEVAVGVIGGAIVLVSVTVDEKLDASETELGASVVSTTLVSSVVVEGARVDDGVDAVPLLEPGPVVKVTVITLTDVSVPVPVTVWTEIEVGSLVATVTVDVVPIVDDDALEVRAVVLLEAVEEVEVDNVIDAEVT